MELVERYIYAVTKRLPEKQRADIEKELRSLIEDMLDERSGGEEPTVKDIEHVLLGLGDPTFLADKYREKNSYLIGPEYFSKYVLLLKIVLTASLFALFVSLIVSYAQTPPDSIAEVFSNVISSIFDALFQGFTWVTIIFALIDHNQPNSKRKMGKKGEFKPSELPRIPAKTVCVKRSGPIVAIIFSVIFLTILNFSPRLFAISLNGSDLIPVFNINVLHHYMLLINISFVCVIFKQILRIVYGKYVIPLAVGSIVLDIVSLTITVVFFSDTHIWNVDLNSVLLQNSHVKFPAGFDITNLMASVSNIIIVIYIFVFVIETVVMLIKTLKYRE